VNDATTLPGPLCSQHRGGLLVPGLAGLARVGSYLPPGAVNSACCSARWSLSLACCGTARASRRFCAVIQSAHYYNKQNESQCEGKHCKRTKKRMNEEHYSCRQAKANEASKGTSKRSAKAAPALAWTPQQSLKKPPQPPLLLPFARVLTKVSAKSKRRSTCLLANLQMCLITQFAKVLAPGDSVLLARFCSVGLTRDREHSLR